MEMSIFFQNWSDIVRLGVVGVSAYALLIVILRLSGKRTLSKMNAFDLVVTIALGSTLSTVMLDKDISLAEGVFALALLAFLQLVMTWLSVRCDTIGNLIKSEPTLLVKNGAYLEQAMHRQRVTKEEIDASLRQNGYNSISGISCVVLETDGSLSVIP